MRTWKSKKIPPRHDIWTSEVRLRTCNAKRLGKVKKLLRLLRENFDERVP
jgi:hypothetical protein